MSRDSAEDLLRDIKEFARFFRSLWGLLAGGSLFFPFVNLVIDAVPYPHETVKQISAAFAILGSAFVFLLVYITRQPIFRMDDVNLRLPIWMGYRRLPLAGYRSVVLSSIVFILFIVLLGNYLKTVWSVWSHVDPWNRHLLVYGILEYGFIFMLATLAFSVLATSEYMRQWSRLQEGQRKEWPYPETALAAIQMRLPQTERPKYPSELVVISEVRSERDGTPILEMIAQSGHGPQYEVKVDRSGNVLEFRRLEQSPFRAYR